MLKNNGFHNRHSPFSRPFSPASFFANGEQGWWYDPSNFATLFQDAAGTTPVTAVEQPVGLQLDLSKGLVLGTEQYITGSGAWTRGFLSVNGTISASGTAITITQGSLDSSGFRWVQPITCVVGSSYRFYAGSITLSGGTGATIGFTSSSVGTGLTGDNSITSGQVPLGKYITATATTMYVVISLNGGTTGSSATFDNISVKELPGNHRFQTTSANRPVVSARVNLLTKTEQFNDAAWTKENATITPNGTVSPDGTTTADLLIETAVTGRHRAYQNGTITNPSTVIGSVCLKDNTRRYSVVLVSSASAFLFYALVDLQTGTILEKANFSGQTGFASASIATDSNGFYRVSLIGSVSDTSAAFQVLSYNSATLAGNATSLSYAGDITKGIYIWGADLRVTNQGVGLPAYQRVNTSTDYDSVGFPTYIKPNGSNQFMVTNSINFSGTDKMTVWQGVRKLSDAAGAILMELSTTAASNNGSFYITAPESGNNYGVRARGAGGTGGYNPSTFTAPITNVVAAEFNLAGATVAACVIPRINGVVNQTNIANVLPGGGNFGTYPAYFYARAGTIGFFGGNDYGSIARGAASTAAQITGGETYINSKTKAY